MEELTINQWNKVRLLVLSAINICHDTDKFIHLYIVRSSLNVQLQVLSFVAEELASFDNNPNLLR